MNFIYSLGQNIFTKVYGLTSGYDRDVRSTCQTCLSNVIPINDITGNKYSEDERQLRCKVAAVYRLIHYYGWDEVIYNHTTVRVNGDEDHFILNPFGLLYNEVTATSLIKVDLEGNMIDQGSTNFSFNRAGFVIHSAIHSTRPDIKALIHLHNTSCVAVSSMKCGLLANNQWAAIVGDVSYYDYQGLHIDTEESKQISDSFGPINKVMILKNHGVVAGGQTIEEALYLMRHLLYACETQIKSMSCGLENIDLMPRNVFKQVNDVISEGGLDVMGKPGTDNDGKQDIWKIEFDAQIRMLDNQGLSTGLQCN